MPLTPADEYLTHQTPHTFDTVATSDRNFYDRYFFNGYRRDGEVYFAVAMGLYPNLGVFDCAFSVVHNGRQRFVRASRALGPDRMATAAGAISVEVLEPLKRLRVRVAPNQWGVSADLVFEARSLPMEEPHFLRRNGPVLAMDYTRMTQHGEWTGTITVDGMRFDVRPGAWWGSRDHSWGIRNVGGRDPRGAPPTAAPQFYWNWAPLNFEDRCFLFTTSELPDGTRWHESGEVLTPYPDATATRAAVSHELTFESGTRWIGDGAKIRLTPPEGEPFEVTFKPFYHFLMKGIGYGEPEWGHGMWVGPDEQGGGEYVLSEEDPMANLHVQTLSEVTARGRKGIGIFEIIIIGPYLRYGFNEMMDAAP